MTVKEFPMCRTICRFLAGLLGMTGFAQAGALTDCNPHLTFTSVQFSATQPKNLDRRWTAVLAVDASRCSTSSGIFTIGFARLKENAPDADFVVTFTWHPATVEVSVDFWADEAVQGYWLNSIASCLCRG